VSLDLRRTLRPLGGRFADDGWWRAARTPHGPGTIHLRRDHRGVLARAWGPGGEWILARVPRWIGLADSPESLVTDHDLVERLARRHVGVRFGATGLVFDALVTAIVTQKVTGKEASRSLAGLHRRFSAAAPGPRLLRLPPDPERLARAPYWELHTLGLERRRADILRVVARDHQRIDALASAPPDDVQTRLRRYPGIGAWTAAETVAVSHGDADAVSVGDYHHKNLVSWHLAGRPRGTDEEMLVLLEPFRPHRGRVVRLLELEGWAPAFGPRLPLRSIADR
jgi:3-methyladenine DNA glycosylase/8-oxoguanine DNA glycosylase